MKQEEKQLIAALKVLINDKKTRKKTATKVTEIRAEKKTLSVIDYSEKCYAIIGTSKEDAPYMKEASGRFNGHLSCGAGWVFAKSKWEDSKNIIEKNFIVNEVEDSEDIADDEELKNSVETTNVSSCKQLLAKVLNK